MKHFIVQRTTLLCVLLCTFFVQSFCQSINKVEYFVDADPGFGNATAITFTPTADTSGLIISVNTVSLSTGFHNVFMRSQNTTGRWSLTNHWLFFKDKTSASVNKVEYFVDSDPGFGNATNVSI